MTPRPASPSVKDGVPCVPSALPVHPVTGNPDWKTYFNTIKGWRDRWFIANQQTARDIVRMMKLDDGGPPKTIIEAYPGAFLTPPLLASVARMFGQHLGRQVLEWLPARCLNCQRVW